MLPWRYKNTRQIEQLCLCSCQSRSPTWQALPFWLQAAQERSWQMNTHDLSQTLRGLASLRTGPRVLVQALVHRAGTILDTFDTTVSPPCNTYGHAEVFRLPVPFKLEEGFCPLQMRLCHSPCRRTPLSVTIDVRTRMQAHLAGNWPTSLAAMPVNTELHTQQHVGMLRREVCPVVHRVERVVSRQRMVS